MTVHWHDDEVGYCPCDEPTVTVEDKAIWRTTEDGDRQQVGTIICEGVDWYACDDRGNARHGSSPEKAVRALLVAQQINPNEYPAEV